MTTDENRVNSSSSQADGDPGADFRDTDRIIFVGGAPRSGTTLVQNMLDSHPEIAGPPEFLHLPQIIELHRKMKQSLPKERDPSGRPEVDVDRCVRRMIVDFLLPYADRAGCHFLSEKTPENVLAFGDLLDLFPAARFIHVVRDPRAVVASLLGVARRSRAKQLRPPSHTTNVVLATEYTRRCLDAGFRASARAPDRVYTVVYERLVEEPGHETQALCNFLGLPWSTDMMTPGNKRHEGEEVMTTRTNEIWYDRKSFSSDPVVGNVEKWKNDLSRRQLIQISAGFQDQTQLTALGYDVSVGNE